MVAPEAQYFPGRGDLVYLDFNPTKGHEQQGHRPAFVASPRSFDAPTAKSTLDS